MKQPRITFSISRQALKMLERLATSGIYGRGVPGVAREILYAGLRRYAVERDEVRKR